MFPGVWVPVPTEFLRSPWYKKLKKWVAGLKESGGRLIVLFTKAKRPAALF